MKVVGVPVRDPDVRRPLYVLDFFGRQWVVEGPAAEVAGTLQPRVGREYGLAVNFELNGRVTQGLEGKRGVVLDAWPSALCAAVFRYTARAQYSLIHVLKPIVHPVARSRVACRQIAAGTSRT